MKDYFLKDGGKLKKFGQKNRANVTFIKSLVQKTCYVDFKNLRELINRP